MSTHDELTAAAAKLLVLAIELSRNTDGGLPTCSQTSNWMVADSPSSWSTREHTRPIIDHWFVVSSLLEALGDSNLESYDAFLKIATNAGVAEDYLQYGLLRPLIQHWATEIDLGETEDDAISIASSALATAVLEKTIQSTFKEIVVGLALPDGPLALEDYAVLRRINENELFELGEEHIKGPHLEHDVRFAGINGLPDEEFPAEDWLVFEMVCPIRPNEAHPGERTAESLYAALSLIRDRPIVIRRFDERMSYLGIRRRFRGQSRAVDGSNKIITVTDDLEESQELVKSWPRLKRIMADEEHFLAKASVRLQEGMKRTQSEDAVIDFSIGLEALLLAGEHGELSYRFALRGATILGGSTESKREQFRQLRSFYDTRSSIVHASSAPKRAMTVDNARAFGQAALRQIWWWMFDSEVQSPIKAAYEIDAKIMS
ncbi:MAG: hypothetical protein HQ478_13100 [Chloroflexi bacterium]|nr:hypothetical protein [Chloroflexota bacterium]